MTEPSTIFRGPDAAMIRRVGIAMLSPSLIAASDETKDRIQAAYEKSSTWADLPDDVRDLLLVGEREVQAGLSPALYDPSEWGGDWAAEDRELVGEDLDDPPGFQPGESKAEGVDFDEPDDLAGDLPGVDDDGWVGV